MGMTKRLVVLAIVVLAVGLASRATAQDVKAAQDVIYGRVDGAALLADIAYPTNRTGLPAVLSVHGGRWRAGNRTDASSIKVAQWAGFGFFAMSIDYRLVGTTPAPAPYQDFYCALRWLHAHAKEYNVDEDRIYLVGESAGGHMVTLADTLGAGPYPKTGGWNDARDDFRAVVSISGAYELNSLSWGNLWTPLDAKDIQQARTLASPIAHIGASVKPILILHSDDDRSVPIQQALDMVDALKKANAQVKFIHYKDRGHMNLTDEVVQETRAFIAEFEPKR
jgi:alpha-L-fucosidase 2